MTKGRVLLAALAAAALAAIPASDGFAQKGRAAVARDWTQTISRTPEGGFRMGNPAAPVKLIEYLSFACPHCAHFHEEGGTALLQNYVRPGRVSLEYRNILISAPDLAATALARCASGRGYFNMGHELMRSQAQWTSRSLSEAQRAQLRNQPPTVIAQRLAPMLGLDRIAARHGLTPTAQRACLSNMANFNQLEAMSEQASRVGVTGTPTFVINGRVITNTNEWSGIEPLLRGG